jgi:hypothetical protein
MYAPIITRRQPRFPFRNGAYFDLTKWGGGYVRYVSMPGAIVVNDEGLMMDLRSGEVYFDNRFKKKEPA